MEHVFHPLLLFFVCSFTMSFAADILQNPDFENPPANVTLNSTSQFLLLNKSSNSIPGWSFNGTVWYVTYGGNLSFPGNNSGHALQLAENGTISQTIRGVSQEYSDYILTFSLIAQNEYCVNYNHTGVNISVHYKESSGDTWKVFTLDKNLTRNLWLTYGLFLGILSKGEPLKVEIKSVATNSVHDNNVTCWPIVDTFRVKRNGWTRRYSDNMLSNGDFEYGPSFVSNSSDGIILTSKENVFDSPIQQWSILGAIKYIDSKHYKVPHGKAAIQFIYGDSSGIKLDLILDMDFLYSLNFTIGDANDSCVGDLMVFLQIANDVYNFTIRSIGTGTVARQFVTFRVSETMRTSLPYAKTSIIFYTLNETRRSDGVLCGPVLDNVVLLRSYGERVEIYYGVLFFSLFLALVNLLIM